MVTSVNEIPWIGAAIMALAWISKECVSYILKQRKQNLMHKTFADDPDQYWRRMKEVVTDPISVVLSEQSKSMTEIMKELVRLEASRDTKGRR